MMAAVKAAAERNEELGKKQFFSAEQSGFQNQDDKTFAICEHLNILSD